MGKLSLWRYLRSCFSMLSKVNISLDFPAAEGETNFDKMHDEDVSLLDHVPPGGRAKPSSLSPNSPASSAVVLQSSELTLVALNSSSTVLVPLLLSIHPLSLSYSIRSSANWLGPSPSSSTTPNLNLSSIHHDSTSFSVPPSHSPARPPVPTCSLLCRTNKSRTSNDSDPATPAARPATNLSAPPNCVCRPPWVCICSLQPRPQPPRAMLCPRRRGIFLAQVETRNYWLGDR